jgi:hypothetical protein
MKKTIFLVVLILIGFEIFSQTTKSDSVKSLKFNEFARFYAGLDQDSSSTIKYTKNNPIWLAHKKSFTKFWDSATTARINPMKEFAKTDLKILADSVQNLLYPFSGPDFLHADIFFPNAQKIVMLGLERVGNVPQVADLTDKQLGTFFKAERRSLDSIFIWGYFMTNDMNRDFARCLELKGVVPVIMLSMAKADFEVQNVKKVTINSKGDLVNFLAGRKDIDDPKDTYISGVEIKYRKIGETNVRTLYYFSHDASDENLKRTPEFVKFLDNQHFDATYLKAASYLCGYLNTVRTEALKSKYVFQDDSGIEIRYFEEKTWKHQLWGTYTRPIRQFKWAKQPKLKELYYADPAVKSLPFKIGYCSRFNEGNLMLFSRK